MYFSSGRAFLLGLSMLVFLNSLRGKGRMFPAAEQGSSRCVCEIAARAGINLKNVLRSICNVF